jgi:hypothetical protein
MGGADLVNKKHRNVSPGSSPKGDVANLLFDCTKLA